MIRLDTWSGGGVHFVSGDEPFTTVVTPEGTHVYRGLAPTWHDEPIGSYIPGKQTTPWVVE